LENVLERAVILYQGTVVMAQDLPALRRHLTTPVLSDAAFRLPAEGVDLWQVEKELIRQALERTHENKSQAAKLLRLSRTQLRTRRQASDVSHAGFQVLRRCAVYARRN
jgi:DNA-binding NtrC family response regulator